jgi:transcriptional regulator
MYRASYFQEKDNAGVIAFVKENPFAIVTGIGEQYPVATHLPLEIEIQEDGFITLSGHMMKKSDHYNALLQNENVLVLFNGPHTYISASWYTNPQGASTWNYMTVHAKGKIKFTDDEGTYDAIKKITNKYEGKESAAAFDKMDREYIDKMLKAIVGFTIEVKSFENVFKLSQNRDKETQLSIAKQLMLRGDEQSVAIAKEMNKRMAND